MSASLVPELICSDIERSLWFYRDLLGFRVVYTRPEDRFAYLERDGAVLMLEQPQTRDRLWPTAELAHPYGRGMNLEIQLTDVDFRLSLIRAAGFSLVLPLEEMWYR